MMNDSECSEVSADETSFTPREDLIDALMSMGVTRNAAMRGLLYTGNSNADLAAAWIFENDEKDLDQPIKDDELSWLGRNEESDEDEVIEAAAMDYYKMVFVVNSSLNMGVGKVAAQVGHATLGLYRMMIGDQQKHGPALISWEQFGETKIVVKGKGAEQLKSLAEKAQSLELPHHLVQDAGRTQIEAGSITILGLMGKVSVLDQITGKLKVL